EDAVGLPVTKKKSKKKKKGVVRTKVSGGDTTRTIATVIGATKAKTTKTKEGGGLVIHFPLKATKAERRKFGKKYKPTRDINFSSVLGVEDLEYLRRLSKKHIIRIKAKHIHSLLRTKVTDGLTPEIKKLYEKAVDHLFETYVPLDSDFTKSVLSKAPDLYAEGLRQTVAYQLMTDAGKAVNFFTIFTPFAIKYAYFDKLVCESLTIKLREPFSEGCKTWGGSYASMLMLHIEASCGAVQLLDLSVDNPDLLDVMLNAFTEIVPGSARLDQLSITILQEILSRKDGIIFSRLVRMARDIPRIRDLIIATLEMTYLYDGSCMIEDTTLFSSSALGEFIALAEDDSVVMDFLVKILHRTNAANGLTILHDTANRNLPIFKQLVALGEINDSMFETINGALLSSDIGRVGVMVCFEPVLVPLIELALDKPEFVGHLANSLMGTKQLLYRTDGLRDVCFVERWLQNPRICKEEYPYVLQLAEKSSEFARAFVACLLEKKSESYDGLLLFAVRYSEELVSLIELAIKKEIGFELLFTNLEVSNEDGITPLLALESKGYDQVNTMLQGRTKRRAISANPERLFVERTAGPDDPECDDAEVEADAVKEYRPAV
ncbi:MAG: hypothetical protein P1U34_12580, partial [Coxiellaceae bacterium]|nr:hypothetical protein [Coxiellaceae bacterium]